jgi:hypothetical protein
MSNRWEALIEQLHEIEQREQAATRGPWKPDERYIVGGEDIPGSRPGGEVIAEAQPSRSHWPEYTIQMRRANSTFIAHARQDIPWLLSQLRALLAGNERLQGDVRRQTERADAVELIESRGRGLAQERADRAEAALAAVRDEIITLAEAWREGYQDGWSDRAHPGEDMTRNPYAQKGNART